MKNFKLFALLGTAALSVVVIRCIQIVFLTDNVTGFYKDGMNTVGSLLSFFIILIIAITSLISLFLSEKKKSLMPDNSIFLGVAALLSGISHIIEPFALGNYFSSSVPYALIVTRNVTLVAAGLVFCYFGICFIANIKAGYFASVVLVIAFAARLMSTFVNFTGMSNISENIYDVAMLITMVIFFLVHSKALCNIPQKRSHGATLLAGTSASLLAMVSALPTVFVSVFGLAEVIHTPVDSPVTCFFTALYIVAYLRNII